MSNFNRVLIWIERAVWASVTHQTENNLYVVDVHKLIKRLKSVARHTLKLYVHKHTKPD